MADVNPGRLASIWSGRWVLLLPLALCLFALVPVPMHLLTWADSKVFDLFFVLPFRPMPEHPVVVVVKDETFPQIFQRNAPNRSDFAQALQIIASAGVRVAGFDFLFEEAQSEETDRSLVAALRAFPAAVIASMFKRRKAVGGLEQIIIADVPGVRPPPPSPLYSPLAGSARDIGLTNVFLDFDGVARYIPLAFLPNQATEFMPTLGFATWIQQNLAMAQADLASAPFPAQAVPAAGPGFQSHAQSWLKAALGAGPRKFNSTGHAGLDRLLRRREIRWLSRWAATSAEPSAYWYLASPQTSASASASTLASGSASYSTRTSASSSASASASTLASISETMISWDSFAEVASTTDLPAMTWLNVPPDGIPWIGDYEAPCLRLPFTRQPWPFKGDGIRVISLAYLLSAFGNGGLNFLEIEGKLAASGPVDLEFDLSEPGSGCFMGRALDLNGHPLEGISAFCRQSEGGYWASATTDSNGDYTIQGLPAGTYSVELLQRTGENIQTLSASAFLDRFPVGATALKVRLPEAHFLSGTVTLTANLPFSSEARALVVVGDPVWIEKTGSEGRLTIASIPAGFEISALDDGPALSIPAPSRKVAVCESRPYWRARSLAMTKVPAGASVDVRLHGISPGLAARVMVLGDVPSPRPGPSPNPKPEFLELDLWAGETVTVASIPAISSGELEPVRVSFRLPSTLPQNGELSFLHENGYWRSFSESDLTRAVFEPGSWRIFWANGKQRGSFNRLGALFSGKAVLFGSHLAEDQDFQVTPVNFLDRDFKKMAGVNLHAHLFSALSRRDFLRPFFLHQDASPGAWPLWNCLCLLPILFLLEFFFERYGAIAGAIATITLASLWGGAALAMFTNGWLLPVALPVLSIGSFGIGRGFHAYVESRMRERLVRSSFGRFVSDKMVQEIVRHPDSVKPGGEKKEITVMFTDLAGFTTISELLTTEQLGALMNEYLGEMTNILFQFDGTLDKYIGDAVMSFWNHPSPQKDHALRAARCAIAMQRRLAELRKTWVSRGLPVVSMRAGINTADAMVGFFGSSVQMNFTCLGDGVNLASRLEGANKAYHTLMMVSESTDSRLAGSEIRTRFLDFLAVKGKTEPIRVFELIGVRGENDAIWEVVLPLYDRGIARYLDRDWDGAGKAFHEILKLIPDDGPSLTYIERAAAFRGVPPPENWDGRYILKTK